MTRTTLSTPGPGVSFVCSWSGGKDSCLALYRAVTAGAEPRMLLSMLREDGVRSRSHGLSCEVLRAQADSLGIPLVTKTAPWSDYESVFIAALQGLKATGIEAGVFGDIDIEEHRLWEEKVCGAVGIEAYLPLWKGSRLALLGEFLMLGFEATIVVVNSEKLDQAYLGRVVDLDLVCEFASLGIDPSGEEGEYHTVVTNGPIFSEPVWLETGEQMLHEGYWFLDVMIRGA
ncbi:MAG: diphthine--ammonia ligase [Anaerolineae bacterium]|nr:diphthine--ammonia ligase [Anaerolineae bacterium]